MPEPSSCAPLARAVSCVLITCACASASLAGRPLNVDDANVNEPGAGHVEFWFARQPGGARVWTVAPAFSPREGMELAGAVSRNMAANIHTTSLQAKFRLTPSQENGCNFGAVVGASQVQGQSGSTPAATGLMTCNTSAGALHMNLGASRAPGGPTLPAYGVAWEQDLDGATGHVECLAQRQSKPTLGFGLRKELHKNFQLDGSVARNSGETLFSVGVKLSL